MNDVHCPKTKGTKLALLDQYHHVNISMRKDPAQRLIEMEEESYDTSINLTETQILLKFLNAFPPE